MISTLNPNPDLLAVRFLLKRGRKYEQAVMAFEPYDAIQEKNPEARAWRRRCGDARADRSPATAWGTRRLPT